MKECDVIFTGGQVVLGDGSVENVDIGVKEGKVSQIAQVGEIGSGAERVDIRGLTVLPGIVDAHIHLGHGNDITRPRAPSDADTETASAAAGGVTSFISYVIASEPYEDGIFETIRNICEQRARVDFGFHLVISTPEQLASVPMYAERFGVSSFKLFMYNRGGEGARLGLPDIDDGFLYRLAEAVHASGAVLCPHCENIEAAWVFRDRLMTSDPEGKGGLAAWSGSRPPFLEAEAVHRVSTLARHADAPVHMVHCSSAEGLAASVAQRALGADLTVETCTQYLTHDVDWPGGIKAKVNPPVRTRSDVEALWNGIRLGQIDTVATDHVHRPGTAKQGGVWKASPGFPGLETLLPVMLSEGHHKRGISLGRIASLLSANPARIMGCRSKGKIAVGKDADLSIVDLNAEWTADERSMRSDAGFSIYDGWKFKGRVVHTVVRGGFAFRDGKLCESAVGTGKYLYRKRGRG
ncbi:dihydroorotase family protein [Bradyrhizobium sp. NP1]|uniref:dihydroorotase n=1 Tax=Bradyrhizobium sp. NP1 TaxID=3049772 RepID=UPI0025A52A4D|nr:dihydroorotase family protein [Bradyrhizobium sp. NP1]WJR80326.1 dihydroorotase family protein [Bradyrhizobium sp. NP1]